MATKARLLKTIGLTAAMGTMFAGGVYADDAIQQVQAFLRPDFKVEVNGKQVKNTVPLIYDGSSYLPFKMIGELLGAVVSWDEDKKTIKLAMPVVQPTDLTTPSSTGGNAGSGTTAGGGTAGAGGAAPIVPPNVDVEEEITLETPIPYNFMYDGVTYPTLVNQYKGAMYVRWKDIRGMPIDVGDPQLSTEKLTGESYVHLDLLKPYWNAEGVTGDVRQYVIVEKGKVDEARLKALNDYFGTREKGYTIEPLDGENEYTVLAKGADQWFVQYNIRFWQSYDGQWNVSSTGWKSYPKDSTGTT